MTQRYFWQLIFIKYTKDNKRVFYPNFFSDGYFITSEDQIRKYKKFGNKFFIWLILIFVACLKLRIIKFILHYHLLNQLNFFIILAGIIFIGIIYNFITEKIIFKHSIKITEKYWVNNYYNVHFLLKSIALIIAWIGCIIGYTYFIACYISPLIDKIFSIILGVIGILLLIFIPAKKFQQRINIFTFYAEKQALSTYFFNELEKLKTKNLGENINIYKIIENIKVYAPDLIQNLVILRNITYDNAIDTIKKYIITFSDFNAKLYTNGINEADHLKIIEEQFIPNFKYEKGQKISGII